MSFAMADPLPQGKKVLISTINSFDIHYRQKLGIICIVCYDLTDDLSFFEKNMSNCSFGEIHTSIWQVFFSFLDC